MANLALVGIGKIARDQHVPALEASTDWTLAATVSRSGTVPGVPAYTDLETCLAAHPEIDTVSLCLPPQPRFAYARAALEAGRHVMLEKPPGQSLAEVSTLAGIAGAQQRTLYASWHSRAARAVRAARDWRSTRAVTGGEIIWKEDVRRWHPGQDWVFEPGGMGVFDPGINALSILTEILPAPVHLLSAALSVPANRQTPIAAHLDFSGAITAAFDWRQEGPQTWTIEIRTDDGTLKLLDGGDRLTVDGVEIAVDGPGEYPALYARLAALPATGASDVDLAPMIHVADALSLGRRQTVAAFHF